MKILCSDYDGTLSHGGVDEKKLAAISAWRKKGNKFGIITGRRTSFYRELKELHPHLELDFMASCNGTVLLDGEGVLLEKVHCTAVPAQEAVRDLLSLGSTLVFINGIDDDHNGYLCVAKREEDLPDWVSAEHSLPIESMPKVKSFHQLTAVMQTADETIPTEAKIREKYGKHLNPLRNGRCIDIVPLGIDKAEGVRRIMKHFGAAFEDMITVGDNVNDTDMLREFRSYAMQSGVESIRAFANGVVSDVTEIFELEA